MSEEMCVRSGLCKCLIKLMIFFMNKSSMKIFFVSSRNQRRRFADAMERADSVVVSYENYLITFIRQLIEASSSSSFVVKHVCYQKSKLDYIDIEITAIL